MRLADGLAKGLKRIHGGADALGVPLHDFSTNSNACGPSPHALAAIREADATAYPDAAYTELRDRLAAFHAVDAARIVIAGSASEFIFRISAWVAQKHNAGAAKVWLPPHAYGDYAHAAAAHGLVKAVDAEAADLVWACDPSSPLGATHAGCAVQGVSVLDRAYEPLRLQGTPGFTPDELEKTWQLWTPNKALGLTGVRVAYAIAPAGVQGHSDAAALEHLGHSWPAGTHGVAMLQAWVTPQVQDWLADSLVVLREWKTRQIGICESLGWTCTPSLANFYCAKPWLPSGTDLQFVLAQLRGQGIKLRDTTSFGLPGQLRLGVLEPASQDALHNAWQQIVGVMR